MALIQFTVDSSHYTFSNFMLNFTKYVSFVDNQFPEIKRLWCLVFNPIDIVYIF